VQAFTQIPRPLEKHAVVRLFSRTTGPLSGLRRSFRSVHDIDSRFTAASIKRQNENAAMIKLTL
jgi:hypothetical protein